MFSAKWGSLETKLSERLNVPAGSERASIKLQNAWSLIATGSLDGRTQPVLERTTTHRTKASGWDFFAAFAAFAFHGGVRYSDTPLAFNFFVK